MFDAIRLASLLLAVLTLSAPAALAVPSKPGIDGPLWPAVLAARRALVRAGRGCAAGRLGIGVHG
jgi:hypothetical protein